MCMACGFTSTTFDPCVDFSLDLEPNQGSSMKTSSTKSNHSCNCEADGMNSSQNCGISTLMGCLDRFTRPERLGSDQKFFCQQCQVRQESLKQMSIRKLPLVSCFHIKRFEHSSVRKMSRKVDRYLQFPLSLDMAPYLSSSILRSRFGNRFFPFDGDESNTLNEPSSEFELFAVVTHTGKLDAGHYVTYLRLSNKWYKCDDAWITEVNENTVRAAQGYMMFYVQKMLYYKASEKQGTSWYAEGNCMLMKPCRKQVWLPYWKLWLPCVIYCPSIKCDGYFLGIPYSEYIILQVAYTQRWKTKQNRPRCFQMVIYIMLHWSVSEPKFLRR